MALRVKLVSSLALVLLCVMSFRGTDAGGATPRRVAVPVAGLIPPNAIDALSAATGREITHVPYAGSLGIVAAMQNSLVQFGAITSDAAFLAFTGRLEQRTAPFDTLRGIAVLDLKTIHLMVGRASRVQSIAGLAGLNVSLGPEGTGTSLVSKLLLDANGLTLADIKEEYVPIRDALNRLVEDQLDAAFMPMVAPSPEAAGAVRNGVRLLDISGPTVEQLRLQHPFLLRTRLPEGTYPGQGKVVHTIGVDLLLVCRADTDDVIVYNFLQSYFAALARTTAVTDLGRATGMSIPLHAGAARYYRERELSR
jgi:uncharacterized protein